jgi:hypothetical protein
MQVESLETQALEPPPAATPGVEPEAPLLDAPPAASGGPASAEPLVEPAVPSLATLRNQVREQLLSSQLPRGMRESLAISLAEVAVTANDERPQIPFADMLRALHAAIPANWRTDPGATHPQEHPAGEAFFTGDAPLTDQQASQIARDQLKRHGFLGG